MYLEPYCYNTTYSRSLEQQLPLLVGVTEVGVAGEAISEAEVIHEELHTAWIPTPKIQQLLSQTQPTKDPNYLTCPALVADVRMVSG